MRNCEETCLSKTDARMLMKYLLIRHTIWKGVPRVCGDARYLYVTTFSGKLRSARDWIRARMLGMNLVSRSIIGAFPHSAGEISISNVSSLSSLIEAAPLPGFGLPCDVCMLYHWMKG